MNSEKNQIILIYIHDTKTSFLCPSGSIEPRVNGTSACEVQGLLAKRERRQSEPEEERKYMAMRISRRNKEMKIYRCLRSTHKLVSPREGAPLYVVSNTVSHIFPVSCLLSESGIFGSLLWPSAFTALSQWFLSSVSRVYRKDGLNLPLISGSLSLLSLSCITLPFTF